MTTGRSLIWIGFLLLAVAVANAQNTPAADERVLLSAQGVTVTEQDLQREMLLLTEAQRAQVLAGSEPLKDLLRRIYQDQHMVVAAERLGLPEDPVIQARMVVARQKILSEALREHVEQQIGQPDFTALAREHYTFRRDEMQLPDQFQAAHIMKSVRCDCERDEKRQQIEQLLTRVQAGADFAELAKAESEDPRSAAQGGDLGRWLQRKDLGDPLTDALLELENGQISAVVETEFGFHIIKRLDFKPAHIPSFEEARLEIERYLIQFYIRDQLAEKALEYLPPQDAQFDEAALEALLRPYEAQEPATHSTPSSAGGNE